MEIVSVTVVFISALSVRFERFGRIRRREFPRNAVQDLKDFVNIGVVKDCLDA